MRRTSFAAVAVLAAMLTSLSPAHACCVVGFTEAVYNSVSAVFTQDGYRITVQKDVSSEVHVNVVGTSPTGARWWQPAGLHVQEPDGDTYSGSPTVYLVPLTMAVAEGPVATTRGPVSVSLSLYADPTDVDTYPGTIAYQERTATGSATFTLPDGTTIGPLAPESAWFRTDARFPPE